MDGWNTTFLLGRPIFRGYVSLPEGTQTGNLCSACGVGVSLFAGAVDPSEGNLCPVVDVLRINGHKL